MRGGKASHFFRQGFRFLPLALMFIALLAPIGNSASTIAKGDIAILKTYADAFNQSRNYVTPSGPAEQYCWTTGTFLAYQPCYDVPTCTQTANLVCTVSGQQGCALDVLSADILAYKNGVDHLNAAYSSFMAGYNGFGASNIDGSLNQMDSAFDAMKAAADEVSQSKLRLPDKIPCPCGSNPADCCIGRCPEARFNYTAISYGKAEISSIRLKSCTDGTPGGQCSLQKPLECVLGQLVGNANKCGCLSGMRATANGQACEFIPCMDGGVSVPEAACSPKTSGKMCVNGQLVDRASYCPCKSGTTKQGEACIIVLCSDGTKTGECSTSKPKDCVLTGTGSGVLVGNASKCGCPSGQYISGNACLCPAISSEICNTTNVTKYHEVTYIFDRGDKKAVNEKYTFEKKSCYTANSTYTGEGCAQLVASIVNSTPIFETQDPWMASTVKVACSRCPAICNRSQPIGLKCGDCLCPPNLGFCDTPAARVNLSGTLAYCADELIRPQKEDYAACAQGFECKANECRDLRCYNRQKDPLQLFIDWIQGLFGFGK
jgi:hypothetical protein